MNVYVPPALAVVETKEEIKRDNKTQGVTSASES